MTRPAFSVRRTIAFVLYNIGAALVLLVVLEGFASIYYTFRDAFVLPPVAESLHTEYDRDLGWVNLPNAYLPNMYGPGTYLRTDSQRFRNNADFTRQVPPGKTRIICSGNSHTLGYGVDNDHTWPQLLAAHAQNIETVNMGQGGYGADQTYLWYKRDGVVLDHDIQILALMFTDFPRMEKSSFVGYGKPVLAVENQRLVTTNVPVPPPAMEARTSRLEHAADALSSLNITHLLQRLLKLDTSGAMTGAQKERSQETSRILSYMLDDLLATNRAKNSVLVLVYLPTREDGGDVGAFWRKFLAEYAQRHGLLYLDLSNDFRHLPPEELDKLFIGRTIGFPAAPGHYSEAGNAFVADLIYKWLLANPITAAKLHTQPADHATSRSDAGNRLGP
jgi:hypothetical protein